MRTRNWNTGGPFGFEVETILGGRRYLLSARRAKALPKGPTFSWDIGISRSVTRIIDRLLKCDFSITRVMLRSRYI
jgi:hypothetical protein